METTLAQRIASRRKELGLSREDLATAAGVTVPAVQAWEAGTTKNLKLQHLFAIADASPQ
ncbi:MAG: helix-turn-helix transcriptional regulator [Hyphomicrobiales bacterium]|nr:helix-turn-helix transcriptional regulator [Hyphomicrobiales bacterium]